MAWTGCYEVELTPDCQEHNEILEVTDVEELDPADPDFQRDETDHFEKQLNDGHNVIFGYFCCYPKDGLDE